MIRRADSGTRLVAGYRAELAAEYRAGMLAVAHEADPGRRPRFRGWVHTIAAPIAAVVSLLLWQAAGPGVFRFSVAVFGVGLVALYGVSGLYHLSRRVRLRYWLSRLDVAMIQLFIAASFTPVAVHTLEGAWETWSLVTAWVIAVVGAAIGASPLRAPRWLSVAAYTAFGSLAVVPLTKMIEVLPPAGLGLLVASGLLYITGGVVYARRRPDPWPRWFGFHEVFHVLVVLGGAAHVVAVWEYTLPLASA